MVGICKTTVVSSYAVLSELLSTVYNLSVLSVKLTDLQHKYNIQLSPAENLKKWLTVLECCETCLELAVMSLPRTQNGRNKLKWTVVSLVQLAKCAGRMVLLLKYKEGLLPHPPFQIKSKPSQQSPQSYCYTLKSGRRVRSVRPVYIQSNADINCISKSDTIKELNDPELIAEAAYIIKPIAHLSALYFAGRKSWKPWILSLTVDLVSLYVLDKAGKRGDLTRRQKEQLYLRQLALLVYLFRSPFYDRNTKRALEVALYGLETSVPFTSRFLVKPLLAYLPLIQQIYFYVWSH